MLTFDTYRNSMRSGTSGARTAIKSVQQLFCGIGKIAGVNLHDNLEGMVRGASVNRLVGLRDSGGPP